ncbi:hypothetical protein EG832_08730 [bacterium]|nr:hypothetical protein [bacterium]
MNTIVSEIIKAYSTKIKSNQIFFTPNIPPNKLQNALKSYASGASEKDVLVLVDKSMFGSAKEGYLLVEDTLFYRPPLDKPHQLALADINELSLQEVADDHYAWTWLHIKTPQSKTVLVLDEGSASCFCQMLQELKTSIKPDSALLTELVEDGSLSKEIDKEHWSELVRIVPIIEGRLHRFEFINLYLQGKEYGKVENSKAGLFNHPKAMLVIRDNKMTALSEDKDVFINGEPLIHKRELNDLDRITLGKDTTKVDYQFQANPRMAKSQRHKDEASQGIIRRSPGLTNDEQPTVIVGNQLSVDRNGINLGGKKYLWKELDEIFFEADYDFIYRQTNNIGNAAGQGFAIGTQNATSMFESQRLSDWEAVFPAPIYKLEFHFKGQLKGKIDQITQKTCVLLDQAIESFSPIDLVKFKC